MKHLRATFKTALNFENITHSQFAAKRNISPNQVLYFMTRDKTLTPAIKGVLFKKWNNPAVPLALFDAHIQDEMEAAGVEGKITFHID